MSGWIAADVDVSWQTVGSNQVRLKSTVGECVCVCVCLHVCVCVLACVHVCVCVCVVSVIVKRPVLPPCAVDGRSRNPLYYYYDYYYYYYGLFFRQRMVGKIMSVLPLS